MLLTIPGERSCLPTMSGAPTLPEPINMSKTVTADSDGLYVEKAQGENELVNRMNNLDPPVSPQEEKKLLRKIDLRLPPFLFILYSKNLG